MIFRFAEPARAVEISRRDGAVAILAAIAIAGFVALALIGASAQRSDEARATQAAIADATDRARAILDRQQRGLDALARIGVSASDATAQQFLDRVSSLAPGIRGAALADPAGAVDLRSADGLDQTALAALAAAAAKEAAADPAVAMLVTPTLHDGPSAVVGLARVWQATDGRVRGIALVAIDAAAFPALDLARADGTPLFAAAARRAKRVALAGYPMTLISTAARANVAPWPSIAAAGVGIAALLGLLALLMHRLSGAERDLARRALVERELRDQLAATADAASRIDELSRTKSQFFAQVTHELRTPLNAILGFSETIRGEIFGPMANTRYLEYAGLIHDAGAHLLSLINDLLDEARIEAGKMEIAPIRIAAPALARSALDLVEMLADGRDIAIATTGLSACPDLNVDPRSMKQVLVNLLSNAIKYTPPGGSIEMRFTTHGDRGVAIEIADTGIGMSPEDLRVAFEPFGRAGDIEARRRLQGTGLGLSLARALVRLHGGELTLSSELDHGTTATVTLPPEAVFARAGAPASARAA
jgi:signal transduction histidine kinase